MLAAWSDILKKALRCVDEVYPDSGDENLGFFPVEDFVVEAATWVVRVVPLRALGAGVELPTSELNPHTDGSGELPLPSNFLRLAAFRMEGWKRGVTAPIYDTDERYLQQSNLTLRGGENFPVVAICDGGTRLEYYSSALGQYAKVADARYLPRPNVGEAFPENLANITAWKCAELTLASMNDVASAQLAAQKVTEHLQAL